MKKTMQRHVPPRQRLDRLPASAMLTSYTISDHQPAATYAIAYSTGSEWTTPLYIDVTNHSLEVREVPPLWFELLATRRPHLVRRKLLNGLQRCDSKSLVAKFLQLHPHQLVTDIPNCGVIFLREKDDEQFNLMHVRAIPGKRGIEVNLHYPQYMGGHKAASGYFQTEPSDYIKSIQA